MLRKLLGFDCMHENKIFLFFLKRKLIKKKFEIFFNFKFFLIKVSKKTMYFNIESISYNVNIQPDIMQNY
jgi:hypothetical protein